MNSHIVYFIAETTHSNVQHLLKSINETDLNEGEKERGKKHQITSHENSKIKKRNRND